MMWWDHVIHFESADSDKAGINVSPSIICFFTIQKY